MKLLQVGVIAVGNEALFTAKLRNTGVKPAVFYVNQVEDADVLVTPEQVLTMCFRNEINSTSTHSFILST